MQAHAVVAVAPRRVEYQSVEVPEPGPDDVVVRLQHSWISPGTEGSFVRGERINGETPWRSGDPLPFPHVPGYQKVGTVEAVGANVHDLIIGQQVFATVSRIDNMHFPTGGHINPAVTHRSQVWTIPEGVSPLALSGLVLAQVGYNCGTRPIIAPGDTAVVIGDGLVGHWAAQTLVARGARVMLVGRHDERLEKFDARAEDEAVNAQHTDVGAAVRAWSPEGIQAVIHTVGSLDALDPFWDVMRHQGHIVSAGFLGAEGLLDVQRLRFRELALHAPSGWAADRMDATRAMIADGSLQTLPLITHRFPVEQAQAAFNVILSRREPHLGVILDWT